jgi:hypothetical protein
MDADGWRVQLSPGDGLVVRSGRSLLLALPKGDAQEAFVDAVRAAIDGAVSAASDAPGRRVARAVAGLVAGADDDAVPPLTVAAATDDGVALLIVGDVDVEITDVDGRVEALTGRDASTWVDRVVRDFGTVRAFVGSPGEVDARSDLGSGAVRGGGFRLLTTRGAVPKAPAAAVPAPAGPAPVLDEPTAVAAVSPDAVAAAAVERPPTLVPQQSEAFVSGLLDEPLPPEELVPLPVQDSPAESVVEGVQVQGIVCSRGHFNDPTSIYCATCGISMVHQTHNLVPGPRPPLGVVVLDDGSVYPLKDDYVLGREPENAEDVLAGRALPLPLEDPEAAVSRVHAKIVLQGWDVRIVDVHSSNGTYVAKPGDAGWTRLPADEPTTILPGTRVTMGSRSMVFDSYRKH